MTDEQSSWDDGYTEPSDGLNALSRALIIDFNVALLQDGVKRVVYS